MSRDNDVFQILVTKGNKAILGPNLEIEALTDGQIGVFDADTNQSVDGTVPVREFFVAVGVGNPLSSINTSAGGTIQSKGWNAYTFRPHTAGRPTIVEVSDFKGNCDTDFTLKVEFSNQRIFRNQGYTPYSHAYTVRTACCEGCGGCPTGDMSEVVMLLANAINKNNTGLLTAQAIAVTPIVIATHGTAAAYAAGAVITPADMKAIVAFNATQEDEATKVVTKLRLTSKPFVGGEMNGGINLSYYNQKETGLIVSFASGFECGGKVITTQDLAFEEGKGTDIQQREYKAGGWNGRPGPYRTSAVTGLANAGFKYFADANAVYDKVVLEYQHEAQGGWLDYKNELATEIAIPEADTVTRTGLLTVLDAMGTRSGFDPLLDDAALAATSPTVVEPTTKINNKKKDGGV